MIFPSPERNNAIKKKAVHGKKTAYQHPDSQHQQPDYHHDLVAESIRYRSKKYAEQGGRPVDRYQLRDGRKRYSEFPAEHGCKRISKAACRA